MLPGIALGATGCQPLRIGDSVAPAECAFIGGEPVAWSGWVNLDDAGILVGEDWAALVWASRDEVRYNAGPPDRPNWILTRAACWMEGQHTRVAPLPHDWQPPG